MNYIKIFENFKNEKLLKDLASKSESYDDFLENIEMTNFNNTLVLYRGMYDEYIQDECFMGDFLNHAKEYGDYVEGLLIPDPDNHILYFNDYVFKEIRWQIGEILIPNIPSDYDIDGYEIKFKEKLKEIYSSYFKENKLSDAMYQLDCDEKCVIDFVYDFCFNSSEKFSKIAKSKEHDFLVPFMLYVAKNRLKKPKNIISFEGSDFYGSDEYVVGDVSKYTKLSDIWKKYSSN
jgi:hypothetical protein